MPEVHPTPTAIPNQTSEPKRPGRKAGSKHPRHGFSGTRIHRIWKKMKERCEDPNNIGYHLYGGRGIQVCERWHDIRNFVADMGHPPSDEHTIDRHPDKNGNYEPGNCRWATMKEQMRNVRYNRPITHNGETLLLCEWAERTGISSPILVMRIDRLGWPINRAFTEPVGPRGGRKPGSQNRLPDPRKGLTRQEWADVKQRARESRPSTS